MTAKGAPRKKQINIRIFTVDMVKLRLYLMHHIIGVRNMDEQTELLRKILEMLTLIAEPQIAQRDEKLRVSLRQIVGKSQAKQKAAMLMDGTRMQSDIRQEIKIDQGDLSKMVKTLRAEQILTQNDKPQLKIPIPQNFFDSEVGR